MRIVFMGTPEFALPALEQLLSSNHRILAVYTRPDKPTGRGRKLLPPPVKEIAMSRGLSVLQPRSLTGTEETGRLAGLQPDLIVVAAYGLLLPQAVLDIPPFGALNIHPSLLPKYRGASPVAYAILNGDEETGVSIMLLDVGMDTGPILAQGRVPIDPKDTSETLEARLSRKGADLLMETIPAWSERRITPRPQDEQAASFSRPLTKAEGKIDWHLPAVELARRVRAFHPWPGCHTGWRGKVLKIIEATALPSSDAVEPGVVTALPVPAETPVGVGTGRGILALRHLQLEGKRAVTAAEFLRGQPDFIGQRLG